MYKTNVLKFRANFYLTGTSYFFNNKITYLLCYTYHGTSFILGFVTFFCCDEDWQQVVWCADSSTKFMLRVQKFIRCKIIVLTRCRALPMHGWDSTYEDVWPLCLSSHWTKLREKSFLWLLSLKLVCVDFESEIF